MCFCEVWFVVAYDISFPISLRLPAMTSSSSVWDKICKKQQLDGFHLVWANAVKLEVDQVVREASLCSWEVLGGAHQVLHLLDQLLDVLARPLELFFMAVQTVPENRVMWLNCIDLWVVTWNRDCPASNLWIQGVTTPSLPRSTSHSLKLYPHSLYIHILSETSTLFTFRWQTSRVVWSAFQFHRSCV